MNVVILGAGESGVGAALLAKKKGYPVFVSDKGPIKEAYKIELKENNIAFEEGQHSLESIYKAAVVIKSPGIPDHIDLIRDLKAKGIAVISEIEFAAKHTDSVTIGITGSNGKTTTTNLTYHLLRTAGLDVGIGGNVGQSFARLVASQKRDYYVLELSSFQLDGIVDYRPDIAILLNISPDHLDRYEYKMENYIRSKFRITLNQQPGDLFIYNEENAYMQDYLNQHPPTARTMSVGAPNYDGQYLTINSMLRFDLSHSSLYGPHNRFNAHCAILAARQLGANREAIQQGLDSFANAPHRMEEITTIKGVSYINDSKATNVDAVYYALLSMEQPIIWVAGGQDKGNDYEPIKALVAEKVRAIVCLGLDNSTLLETFGPLVSTIVETRSCPAAVEAASQLAQPGEVVLLSPACASFDLFENFARRGELFKEAVLAFKASL